MRRRSAIMLTVMTMFISTSLSLSFGVANEQFAETSTEDTLYIRGLVSKVYLEKMQIAVRPVKGKRIRITIDPDTVLEGVSQIDELKKEQQVKVWYSVETESKRAIKIKKMMDLGC